MNEKWSRRLLVVEALLIGVPVSYVLGIMVWGILAFATLDVMDHPGTQGAWEHLLVILDPSHLLVLSVAVAVAVLWYLLFTAIRGGRKALARVRRVWWWIASWGLLALGAALVSLNLPPSVPYSAMATFREFLGMHVLGLPLLIPYAHLLYELRCARRPA